MRYDGSIRSANIPGGESSQVLDYGVYQCMILRVFFTDQSENITHGSKNPQVTYQAVIIGGRHEGKVLSNIRDVSKLLGGKDNYQEQVLRPATKPISLPSGGTPVSEQDGDIVYVAFLEGDNLFPIIIGKGTQPKDFNNTGATRADGLRQRSEFNGVFQQVDKDGNFKLIRKGGSYDPSQVAFIPNAGGNEAHLTLIGTAAQIGSSGGAAIKADSGKIALGTSSVELLQQIVDVLEKLSTLFDTVKNHTHNPGNLGYPVGPPDPSFQSAWGDASSEIADIKSKITQIKGSI